VASCASFEGSIMTCNFPADETDGKRETTRQRNRDKDRQTEN
jgi:hypothetical protein